VPYQLVHQQLEVRVAASVVEIFTGTKRVTAHPRSLVRNGYSTKPEHMPRAHRAHAEWTPERMLTWAHKFGPYTTTLVEHLLARPRTSRARLQCCLGILRLGKEYGPERLETAAVRARRPQGVLVSLTWPMSEEQSRSVTPAGTADPTILAAGDDARERPGEDYYAEKEDRSHAHSPTEDKLHALGLPGMLAAWRQQQSDAQYAGLGFDERFGLLSRLRPPRAKTIAWSGCCADARLKLSQACIEDIDYAPRREIDRAQIRQLASCRWVREHQNLIITGLPAPARVISLVRFAQQACRHGLRACTGACPGCFTSSP